MASKLKIKVNGLAHNVTASLDTPLQDVLHDELIEHEHSTSAAITGPSFVGRHTVTLYLSAGRWAFSSSTGAKHAFVVVA